MQISLRIWLFFLDEKFPNSNLSIFFQETLIPLLKKLKKGQIDECVFAKNGRIISIQFCRKKKKSFCVKAASLICWASSVGFFVLGSLPAFGFNHACHRSWRVYLEQMIRVALLLLLGCSSNSFLLWWSGDWWWDLFEKCHMSDLLRGQSKHWPSGDTTDRFLEKAEETLERRSFWMMIVLSFVRISALISFFFSLTCALLLSVLWHRSFLCLSTGQGGVRWLESLELSRHDRTDCTANPFTSTELILIFWI